MLAQLTMVLRNKNIFLEHWILPAIPHNQENPYFSDSVFSEANVINCGVLERVPLFILLYTNGITQTLMDIAPYL